MNILITGSTDGIGKLAAIKMAKDGHQIYLHGRNIDKLNKVISEVKLESNNDKIDGFVADFSDLDQVRRMSMEINEKISSLDVVINNAGIFKSPQPITKAGYDIRVVVNFFAPILLTNAILDKISKGRSPRIINLSSAAQSPVSMDLLGGDIKVSDQEAYAQSKLALLMWSFYLAKKNNNVAIVALNPGSLLNTNMVKEAYGKFWSSADKGANIIYELATIKGTEEIDGKYFDNDRGAFGLAHPDAYDNEKINELMKKANNEISVNKQI